MSDTRTLKIVVSGDSSGGRRALQTLGSEASATQSKFDKVGGAMAGFATKGGVALGALAVGAGVLGVTTASKMEQAQIAFTNMLGSGQKASAFLKQLQTFANSTPFEFPDLIKSSQQLLAMGFSADKIIPTLTAVGDAVAGMGGSADNIQMVTRAFGQMQAKGKVAGDELLQLTEQGIPAIRILADGYGVSTSEMSKMVTKGQVLSEKALPMLVAGLEKGTKSVKGFGGMMDVQSRTAQGRWSTLVDTVQMGLGNLAIKAFPVMNQGIVSLTAGAGALVTAFQTGKVSKSDGIVGMFTTVGLSARAFGSWVSTDGVPLVTKLGTIFKSVADVVGPVLGVAFASLIVTVRGLWTVFTGITGVLSQHLPVVRILTGAVIAYYGALGIFTAISKAAAAQQFIAYQMSLLQRGGLLQYILSLNIVKAATAAWTVVQAALNFVFIANPLIAIIAGIVLLVGAIVLIATKTTWFQTIWEYMAGAVVLAWTGITTAALWAWNTVLMPVFNFIKTGLGILWTNFQTAGTMIATVWSAITSAVSTAWHTVMAPIFGFIQGGIAIVVAVFRVFAYFVDLYWRGIALVAQWAWNTILKPVFNFIGFAVGVMWQGFIQAKNWIVIAWNAIVAAASWAWNTLLKPVFGWIGFALGVMWQGFIQAKNWIVVAWNAITGAASVAWNTLLKPVFNWIAGGLATLWGVFITAKNWIVNTWNTVTGAIRNGWNTGISVVFGYVKTGVDAVRGAFKTAVDAIGKAWTTMKDLVSKPIFAVLNFIGQNLSKPINKFLTTIGAGALAKLPEWKYAEGGVLPGYSPGRDIHRFTSPTGGTLALSGGEAIMVPEFTRAAGGAGGIARMNALARRGAKFAGGGVWEAMAAWAQKAMPGTQVSSGFRPGDGGSYHAQGSAVDLVPPSMKLFSTIASNWGKAIKELIYTPAGPLAIKNGAQVGMDWYGEAIKAQHYSHVHWAMDPKGMGAPGEAGGFNNLPDLTKIIGTIKGIFGSLKNIGGGLWGQAMQKAGPSWLGALSEKVKGWVSSLFSGGAPGPGGTPTGNRAMGKSMMQAAGWAENQFNSLDQLWQKESKWSTTATNPTSGAYGIPQAYPASKMMLAGADWMTNAATQIKWGLSYIRQTYGSPEQAWAHSVRTGWYDDEGVLPPGRTVAMNGTGRNEYVSKTPPGGGGITVAVTVMGSVTTERDLVKSITLGVRDELRRHADRNGGRTGL